MGALCTSAIFINLKLFPNKELAGAVFKLKLKTLSCEENFYLPSSYTCMKHFPSSGELINIKSVFKEKVLVLKKKIKMSQCLISQDLQSSGEENGTGNMHSFVLQEQRELKLMTVRLAREEVQSHFPCPCQACRGRQAQAPRQQPLRALHGPQSTTEMLALSSSEADP